MAGTISAQSPCSTAIIQYITTICDAKTTRAQLPCSTDGDGDIYSSFADILLDIVQVCAVFMLKMKSVLLPYLVEYGNCALIVLATLWCVVVMYCCYCVVS